jgi:hypothetical protein
LVIRLLGASASSSVQRAQILSKTATPCRARGMTDYPQARN